ncbi:MAG TPA: polysaccharide deacetylase family protein [Terriglobales bacterium]|nr:polysaccharide deacetylase family protein [Terriglobales bacterium]
MFPVATVTTSWDDGDPADVRVAQLLRTRRLPGTFYIPVMGRRGLPTLSQAAMRDLASEGFEIGGHGVSHRNLSGMSADHCWNEVHGAKQFLEDVLGKEIAMFCYPRGRHDEIVVKTVARAGYIGARTTRMLATDIAFDAYRMPTTVHAFNHKPSGYLRNLLRTRNLSGIFRYATVYRYCENWVQLAKTLFDSTLRDGGVWHLYGHSWEIQELEMWPQLEEVLDYVSGRDDVLYACNSEIVRRRTAENRKIGPAERSN